MSHGFHFIRVILFARRRVTRVLLLSHACGASCALGVRTMDAFEVPGPGISFAGRYEIQRVLGEGDRKRTCLARDTKMDRLVAISFVKPEAARRDPAGTEREAKVLGRIGSNANIVSLYDYDIEESSAVQYMVFQYLGGGTLAEYLARSGPMQLGQVLRLGRQLCRGLHHLHARGLVHRDVSPDNVWLDERHAAHLGDFDSAIPVSGYAGKRPITTKSFAAPEELSGGPLDVRTDLYSLGAVLVAAATGARGPRDAEIADLVRLGFPSAFGDLMAELLADSPADRPASAEEVLARLDEIRTLSDISGLIAAGESEKVEFKSSLHHPHGPPSPQLQKQVDQGKLQPAQIRKLLNKAVTKTIAAFLNSVGGTLLIGIDDAGAALGIEPDFAYCQTGKQHSDGWLLSLRNVIDNALGPEIWNAVRVSLVSYSGKTVAVIRCPARDTQTWHAEGGSESFYMRAGNATEKLEGRALVQYVTEHWPG